jgi:hypothetical protein
LRACGIVNELARVLFANRNDWGDSMGYGLIGILVIVLLVAMIFYFVRRA